MVPQHLDQTSLENYERLLLEKEELRNDWNSLFGKLKELNQLGRVKDMEFSTDRHSFKAVIGLLNNVDGIMLCVSMIGRYIGVYYTSFSRKTEMCIYNFRTQTREDDLSYYPFTKEQEEISRVVVEWALHYFPSFQKFDNLYASSRVENMIIDQRNYKELDLFQSIFCTNVHNIV